MSDVVFSTRPRIVPPSWRPMRRPAWTSISADKPSLRHIRFSARTAVAVATLAVALALLAAGAAALLRLQSGIPASTEPPPQPEWTDVPRPVRIFDLDAPILRGSPLDYSARRRSAGDGREDILAYGAPGDAPALRLLLYRRSGAAAAPTPLFAAIARQAAEAGFAVGRLGLYDLMPTRFGRFEVADVTLTNATATRVPCSGFRLALETPSFAISGLSCGAAGQPLTRATLACVIDRLDLASGGDDRAMIDFFAASERRRDPRCLGARLAPDSLHAAWLDDKPVTHPRTWRLH